MIMDIWNRNLPEDLEDCKKQELNKRENNRRGFKKIMNKIEKIRNDANDINNFVPHLKE